MKVGESKEREKKNGRADQMGGAGGWGAGNLTFYFLGPWELWLQFPAQGSCPRPFVSTPAQWVLCG